MKDKHNVIFILVSSSIFNYLLRRLIKFSVSLDSSFLFRSSKFQLISSQSSSNHRKVSPCVFNFSFLSLPFVTGVLHGGSTWCFIKDLIPSRSVHQDSFQRSSSILHLAFRSAILSTLSFEVVLYHSWQFPFMLRDSHVVKNEVF